jgi:hypothetical protein
MTKLCMSCSGRKMTKRRIITLVVVAIGIVATIYAVSAATNNFAILAASPLVLAFAACPIMCAVMAGGMWLVGRLSRNKQKANVENNIGRYSQFGLDNEHESHYYENKGTSASVKETSAELASTEPNINKDNSHNLNLPHPTSKNNSKYAD